MTTSDESAFRELLDEKIARFKSLARDFRLGNASAELEIHLQADALAREAATRSRKELEAAAPAVEAAEENELITLLAALTKLMTAADKHTGATRKPGILIIEEDQTLAKLYSETIKSEHVDAPIHLASTFKQAGDLLRRQPFSIILLNLILPDGDGRELLHDIKYEYALPASVPVLSPVDNDKIRVECMHLGAEKFLVKPFDIKSLAGLIKKLLKNFAQKELSLVPIGSEVVNAEETEFAPIDKSNQQVSV